MEFTEEQKPVASWEVGSTDSSNIISDEISNKVAALPTSPQNGIITESKARRRGSRHSVILREKPEKTKRQERTVGQSLSTWFSPATRVKKESPRLPGSDDLGDSGEARKAAIESDGLSLSSKHTLKEGEKPGPRTDKETPEVYLEPLSYGSYSQSDTEGSGEMGPSRSDTACLTCRRRKQKCDRGTPGCE